MTEAPPADSGTTPPADSGTTPPADSGTTPPADSGTESGTQPGAAPADSGTTPTVGAPTSSSNITVTEVMKASTLPTPGAGGSGGPIATVYSKKAPDVWTPKGWAKGASGDKPNIGAGGDKVTTQTEKVTNSALDNAEATIIKTKNGETTWESKGWAVDDSGGDGGGGTPATGATAGSPGSFTPSGSTAPANLAAMSSITASPTTKWTQGQSVKPADSSDAYWDGTTWKSGTAPADQVAITGVTAGSPGSYQPANATKPAAVAGLKSDAAVGDSGSNKPGSAWTSGQYLELATASNHAYWDGTTWQTGEAPA